MSRTDVHRMLLADARIAARITAIPGRRLADLEQRPSDSVFTSVAQLIATTLTTLNSAQPPAGRSRGTSRDLAGEAEQPIPVPARRRAVGCRRAIPDADAAAGTTVRHGTFGF